MKFKIVIIALVFWKLPEHNCADDPFTLDFQYNNDGIKFRVLKGTYPSIYSIFNGFLYNGVDTTKMECDKPNNCKLGDVSFSYESFSDGVIIKWETTNIDTKFGDCFSLSPGNWYGGPQRRVQKYPLELMEIDGDEPYVIRKYDNFAVAERYWLNSQGIFIYVKENVPLFVEQNKNNSGLVCFNAQVAGPYLNRTRNILEYRIMIDKDPREAHFHAIHNYLGKPKSSPRIEMATEPIWTTWAKFKRDINDTLVLSFAEDIRKQGYENGQIEIDDQWETCYGSQEFDQNNFADIKNTVAKLKELKFRVTLWVHPFVNTDCQKIYNEGKEKGYFVKDIYGNTNASWWNGVDANVIDFTNPDAAEWFSARLRKLQDEIGIDSFKFDAGETDYLLQPAVYENVDIELIPNMWSQSYLRTCAQFGDLVEVRSAASTQYLPVFVRMIDKDSNWGVENGLYTLITTLFQLNINGYPMVLPDMIGGNGYNGPPDAELLVRWTQANTFMPAMQFSYLPWEITSDEFDAAAIVKKFVDLHNYHASDFSEAFGMSVEFGWPVNPPVWWVDPTDLVAQAWDDEYMVADAILVAPVIQQGARSRHVFLPKGQWMDGNNGTIYEGGRILYDYPAPIDVLPYFYYMK